MQITPLCSSNSRPAKKEVGGPSFEFTWSAMFSRGAVIGIFPPWFFLVYHSIRWKTFQEPKKLPLGVYQMPLVVVSLELFSYIRNWHRLTSRMVKLVDDSVHFIQVGFALAWRSSIVRSFPRLFFLLGHNRSYSWHSGRGTESSWKVPRQQATCYSNSQCHLASRYEPFSIIHIALPWATSL